MLQLFPMYDNLYMIFLKSPSQSGVMNALKVIHIDAYYGSVCECLTTHELGSKPEGLSEYFG